MKKGGGTTSPYPVLCRGEMRGVDTGGLTGVTGEDTWIVGDSKGIGRVVQTMV